MQVVSQVTAGIKDEVEKSHKALDAIVGIRACYLHHSIMPDSNGVQS